MDHDDDGHWYLYLVEHEPIFLEWLKKVYDEDYYGPPPEEVKQIDGPHSITFENPEEILYW